MEKWMVLMVPAHAKLFTLAEPACNPSNQQETASATSSKTRAQTSVPATKNNAPAQESPAFLSELWQPSNSVRS